MDNAHPLWRLGGRLNGNGRPHYGDNWVQCGVVLWYNILISNLCLPLIWSLALIRNGSVGNMRMLSRRKTGTFWDI